MKPKTICNFCKVPFDEETLASWENSKTEEISVHGRSVGWTATCNKCGKSNWRRNYTRPEYINQ